MEPVTFTVSMWEFLRNGLLALVALLSALVTFTLGGPR